MLPKGLKINIETFDEITHKVIKHYQKPKKNELTSKMDYNNLCEKFNSV
jgi:hypothetical protein